MQTNGKNNKIQGTNNVFQECKKKSNIENKIKVNLYLIYPNNVYYEMMISPSEVISNLLLYIEKFFPKDKYEYICVYKNDSPVFINFETGDEIDISKTYIEHGFYIKDSNCSNGYGKMYNVNEPECSIKIKLKIIKLKEIVK